jgi:hypothetical protein
MPIRILAMACLFLFGTNVGLTTGILAYWSGSTIPICLMSGAGALGSTVLVGAAVWTVIVAKA